MDKESLMDLLLKVAVGGALGIGLGWTILTIMEGLIR